jgi:putative tryptophan/tyrosine transport system substrate-binding protein
MKKIFTLILNFMVLFFVDLSASDKSCKVKILISKTIDHPALDKTTQGIIDGLSKGGYDSSKNLDLRVESAQGNICLASQIATKFANQSPDVLVGIGTTSSQTLAKFSLKNSINLIFSSVTDPVGAGLNKGKISGVSNFVALEAQLELFKKIQPNLKKLGIIYNPAEMNSVKIVEKLKEICPKLKLEFIEQAVNKSADIGSVTTKIVSQVDAIFISNDNTALGALQTIIAIANKFKKPVYVSDTDAVESGALAAMGPNQYQIGIQTANMIVKILGGTKIEGMPIESVSQAEIYLNKKIAKQLGIVFSKEIEKSATKIIE